jgi:hypothetical protein
MGGGFTNANNSTAGGGGGGGLAGGGGGGADGANLAGGGGGGGSGLCPTTCLAFTSGIQVGDGLVTITFTVAGPAPTPAVPAAPRFTG